MAAVPVPTAGAQTTASDWTFENRLRIGLTKQEFNELANVQGARMACVRPTDLEVPIGNVEVCEWASGSRTVSAVFTQNHESIPKVVAYSVKGTSRSFSALRAELTKKYGRPSRHANGSWGENIVWQFGPSSTVLHSVCAIERSCLEVSQDMVARRLARSSGVFLPTRPKV